MANLPILQLEPRLGSQHRPADTCQRFGVSLAGLKGKARGFEAGHVNVNQTLLARLDSGRSCLPLTRADLYAET